MHTDSQFINSVVTISGLVRECAAYTDFPEELFQRITDLFTSRSAVYYPMGELRQQQPLGDGIGFQLDMRYVHQYREYYRAMDPCFSGLKKRTAAKQPLIISTDQVIATECRYVNSEYYQDFLKPQKIHNSIIFAVGDQLGMIGLFGFHRDTKMPRYSGDDHLRARLFASQLATSLRLRELNRTWRCGCSVAQQLMQQASIKGYLVLDRHLRVVDGSREIMEEYAESLPDRLPADLQDYIRRPGAGSRPAGAREDWVRLFDNVQDAGRIRVSLLDDSSQVPLWLLLFLQKDAAMVSDARMRAFALTKRERDIVHQVCRGFSNARIAEQLSISVKTVEHHLSHIYHKTQSGNKVQLIRQLSA